MQEIFLKKVCNSISTTCHSEILTYEVIRCIGMVSPMPALNSRRVIRKERQEHVLLAPRQNSAAMIESRAYDANEKDCTATFLTINARVPSLLFIRQATDLRLRDPPRLSTNMKTS
jgi:hypothetical protein